ncbi:MAG TPA: hypothetical protein VFR47_00375, partial [Anaerolineales bacterium]|nr:hypothetical protein [Anaerolineales bacterium]
SHLTVSKVSTKCRRNRQRIQQFSIEQTKPDLKQTEITTVFSIDQMAQARVNELAAMGKEPNIQKSNG